MTTVALLGTGTMGTGMARRIAGAGLDLRVWNRSAGPAEALADVATVELDAAKAVRGADVVVTMVWDADSVTDVVRAAAPGLAEGTLWLQTSTVGVDGARRLAGLAGELGLVFVDSPVLGTKQPAAQGQLVVLAAGPREAKEKAEPVFDAIGQRTIWVGEEPGQASALKLVVNSWLATVAESVAELLTATRALASTRGCSSTPSRVARSTPPSSASRAVPCSTARSTRRSRSRVRRRTSGWPSTR